ncbi:MAG TPA: ABC transporter permease [Acidimicrobiales bacterium]|nr:ABC transporter permease [Acidimicrobiales bacterium]
MSSLLERPVAEAGRRASVRRWLLGATNRGVVALYVVAVVLLACTRLVGTRSGSASDVRTVLSLATLTALVGFGQGLVVLTGGFDLSVPATMTLAAVVLTGVTQGLSSHAPAAVLLVLGIGTLIGLVNGLVVTVARTSPVIVTLATNSVVEGAALVSSGGQPTGSAPAVITKAAVGGFSGGALVALVVVLLAFLILGTAVTAKMARGRTLQPAAMGARPPALASTCRRSTIVGAYVLSGVSAAIGGLLLAGFRGQSYLSIGDPYLLLSLAAVMVGGASATGGRGLFLGTVAGAIVLQALSTMLGGARLGGPLQDIVFAVAILVAAVLARGRRQPT